VSDGIIRVGWRREDGALVLDWVEQGGPPAAPPQRTGLGSRLIDIGMVGTGAVRKTFATSGFSVEFRAPLHLIEHQIGQPHG
jgi:two-component sensor histidine kinase